ncbi:tyrosine-type recombinase/integrase [Bradyrhizobium sp. AUGA SZCCT0177]|uniref:tyrosine-type recombinase/integrase n=1 Tax=Bradyrhizobium sp. AUGA SZCCT0177 TaxID=2807665 RepID=UPI001BAAA2B5|nr:tyrosine-type recombinase/integrase [Bradyrhizobium sp. AUGA SZCCT0177]MBR1286072.1 tyrosine-type recombinase/integrase [Bradyrhizobium sp. AUGA SZCCT0177]
MPRRIRSSILETRTARLKLAPQRKPYWITVAPGISLGYRRNAGPGAWNVRAADGAGGNWIKSFALADDREDADGATVLDFWQAADKAKQLARGTDADAGRPSTVDEALTDYAADLAVRGASAGNANHPRHHLTPGLLSKPVSMLTVKEMQRWRNDLVVGGIRAATVNRMGKSLKAALNLAASHDDRITNAKAWTVGLAALPEDDDTESNIVLSDDQRRDVVTCAYAISAEFGIYVEVHAATGARSGQIALLDVGDLHLGKEPRLLVPSSLKGRNRRTRTRKPMPITASLARRLKALAAGRGASEPLLLMNSQERWKTNKHRWPFAAAAKAARLPEGATIYALRHTAITRALLAGAPVRLVASSFDTSVAMIERTYSRFIADHGDAQMRRALFDIDATVEGNVISMR